VGCELTLAERAHRGAELVVLVRVRTGHGGVSPGDISYTKHPGTQAKHTEAEGPGCRRAPGASLRPPRRGPHATRARCIVVLLEGLAPGPHPKWRPKAAPYTSTTTLPTACSRGEEARQRTRFFSGNDNSRSTTARAPYQEPPATNRSTRYQQRDTFLSNAEGRRALPSRPLIGSV